MTMPAHVIPSFLFFCFIEGITPGPANLASLNASLRYGKNTALKQWRGLFTGFFADALLAVFLNYFFGMSFTKYVHYLSWIGAAYILWLAFHILTSKAPSEETETDAEKSCNFLTGFIIQVTNAKVILFCISALSTFVLPYSTDLKVLLLTGCFLPFTGPFCYLCWLFAGASLQSIFKKHWKLLNIIMAVSLILCAITLFL